MEKEEQDLIDKWKPFLEGVEDDKEKDISKMLENQEKYLSETLLKDLTVDNVSFPIIRKVFPSMIANDIVSVQPMRMTKESAESVCKMANGLVERGIVKGEYDKTKSKANPIYYLKATYKDDE